MNTLKIYKMYPEAHLPVYGTDWAACFDLRASIRPGDKVTIYERDNFKNEVEIEGGILEVFPGERALVPTGLIFDLEESQSIRLHPRSGLSLKNGITLANCEGVVDADYVEETRILILNMSDEVFTIRDGDRLCQAEVVLNNRVSFSVAENRPEQKTNRAGGYGSTGVS